MVSQASTRVHAQCSARQPACYEWSGMNGSQPIFALRGETGLVVGIEALKGSEKLTGSYWAMALGALAVRVREWHVH